MAAALAANKGSDESCYTVRHCADGSLWLRREARPGDFVRWTVLDPRGEPAGFVWLPREFRRGSRRHRVTVSASSRRTSF